MDDKEIAFALGERLLKANLRVSVMQAALDRYRETLGNVPWRQGVDEVFDLQLKHLFDERMQELRHRLDEAKPEDSLHTLHKFLSDNLS